MNLDEFKALGFKMDKFIEFPTPKFLFQNKTYCVVPFLSNFSNLKSIGMIEDINKNSYYYGFYLDNSTGFRIVRLDKKYCNKMGRIKESFLEYYKQNI